MESILMTTIRDILCASMSLDDGLSSIQNISFRDTDEGNILFDVARAIEEIILRRPGLASAKLTELTVRLSFGKNRILPELLMLLDTRYTNSHKRAESELLPDIEAIPRLMDILGDLTQAIISSIRLNLRPVLPFFVDEVQLTLDSLHDRRHDRLTTDILHEVHYISWILIDAGFFAGAELLLNRINEITSELKLADLGFETTFDYACVLTELRLFEKSRDILKSLEKKARTQKNTRRLAEVTLQLAVNETRDDTIDHPVARKLADRAAELYDIALKDGSVSIDELGLAHLIIGSSILANGWREAVPEAVERLEMGLRIYESIEISTPEHGLHVFRTLAGLGFAHGLMGDYENMTKAMEYLSRSKDILNEHCSELQDISIELANTNNAIGWLCLGTDSDEFWYLGRESFKKAEETREQLLESGRITDLDIIGTRIGLALSEIRAAGRSDETLEAPLRDILVQYVPLFPTDSRAYVEIAISTYNTVWLLTRHGGPIPQRLLRLLEDIDRMLIDATEVSDPIFIEGVSLVVPYLSKSWSTLLERSKEMGATTSDLADVAKLSAAMSAAKLNVEGLSLEMGGRVLPTVDDEVSRVDSLLAQYWQGQTYLVQTIRDFFENKDYSQLASGLYRSAIALGDVMSTETDFDESAEFIVATAASLSQVVRRFALALENQYAAYIDRSQIDGTPPAVDETQYSLLLTEDWLGLIKIANAYLQMIEQSEIVEAQPYLNAVFSNVNRALRMIDTVALVDRRVLALLGSIMNKRYYLRM